MIERLIRIEKKYDEEKYNLLEWVSRACDEDSDCFNVIEVKNKGLCISATDSLRIHRVNLKKKFFNNGYYKLEHISERTIIFSFLGKVIKDNYPDLDKAFPNEKDTIVTRIQIANFNERKIDYFAHDVIKSIQNGVFNLSFLRDVLDMPTNNFDTVIMTEYICDVGRLYLPVLFENTENNIKLLMMRRIFENK